MEKIERGNPKGGLREVISFPEDRLAHGDHSADGVVILRRETSPKSSFCMLFLRDMGALRVSAPGAGARFRGGIEPFTWGTFKLYQSPRTLYIKNVEIAEDFLSVRKSPRVLMCAVKWHKELSSRLMQAHEDNALLSLLWGSMKNLSRGLYPLLLDIRFAWRWANLWGTAPSLEQCPECGSQLQQSAEEDAHAARDGFLCRDCAARTAGTYKPVTREAFDIIRETTLASAENFVQAEPRIRSKIEASQALKKELAELTPWFYSFL